MTVSIETSQAPVDIGTVTGSLLTRTPYLSLYRKSAIGQDQTLFNDSFNATAQNTGIWKSATNLFTFGFSGGYIVFNNSGITTTAAAQIYQSRRTFPLFEGAPLVVDITGFAALTIPTNTTVEVGLFSANLASTPYTPTDGVFFRASVSGGLIGVINYNGTETTTGVLLPSAALQVNTSGTYRIITTLDITEFWAIDSSGNATLLGTLPTPSTSGQPFSSASVPISIRVAFTGTAGSAYSVKFSNVSVTMSDLNTFRPWNVSMCGMGQAYQGLNGGTMGSLALYTNSLNSTAGAVLTNTTAAAGTGLGGQFDVQPSLAAGTDGILCSYQNPAGSVTQTPRTLVINGVKIQGLVTTALVGNATPVDYAYSVAFGHTLVSLATAEATVSKAPRRVPIGFESYAAASAIGAVGGGVTLSLQNPIIVHPGEFFAITAKNLGAVTASGVITFLVTVDHYFE